MPQVAKAVATFEIAQVRGQVLPCINCSKPLTKKLSIPHFHTRDSIISFWTLHCPNCSQHHIVFNCPSVLPPRPQPTVSFGEPQPPSDTENPRLL